MPWSAGLHWPGQTQADPGRADLSQNLLYRRVKPARAWDGEESVWIKAEEKAERVDLKLAGSWAKKAVPAKQAGASAHKTESILPWTMLHVV